MKRKQMRDERLSALLTEAYDAHLDAALSCHCEPVTDVTGVASRSSNTNSKDCHDQCVHWSRNDNKAGGEPEAPVAIRSTSTKRARWQGAVAAILVMTVLGAGGWLLHRQLTRKTPEAASADPGHAYYQGPTPKNCHAELKNGETVWILDADYDGTYDLQKASTRFVGDVITEDWPLPGFEQQTVMSYADYAAYCKQWGLTQTYTDPEQNYLVYAWGGFQNDPADSPRLTDVVWTDDAVTVFLCKPELKQGYTEACIRYPVPWVLTVPVGQKTGTVKVQPVTALADLKPAHIHYADLGGETVYVLDDEDAEYEGEYDLQEADLWEGPGLTTNPVSPEEEAPEGFSQKTVMTYEAYAAYCEKWGLEQKYKDPDRRYLVYATAEFSFAKRQPCLTDVQYFGQTAYLFLYYKTLYHSIDYRSAWVLTVPTDAEVSNLELPRLLTRADYESKTAELARRAKNRMETLPDGSIRIIGYAHVTAVRVGEQNGGTPVEFEVQIDGKTVCVWIEDTELLNPDGTPFTDDSACSAQNDAAPGGGEALPCVCIRAEGCERIEDRGIFGDLPDDYPDYRAARLIVACDPDPEAAFAAVDIEDPSTPQNCHPADLGGETVWVLDDENAEYDGEYDLQLVSDKNRETIWERAEKREGFEQQTVMDYADYVAYCKKWGMEQKYHDPEQHYLVYGKWNKDGIDLNLIDVVWDGQTVYLFLWDQTEPRLKHTTYGITSSSAWVLVIPTTVEAAELKTPRVMFKTTYEWKHLDLTLWEKNKMETLPDGSVRIIGWAERAEPFGHVPPKAFILRFGEESICIWTENTPMWDPEGEPFEDFFDISKEPTGGGLPYRYLFVRAEGCQRIEDRGLNGEPDEYPDYRADWLFLSCNVDPEAAFAAVNVNGSGEQETNPVFTETENGNYLSPWGEEYALLANEGILDCIGTETFVGKVNGEGEGPAWKDAYGFYALDEDEARNILIRVSSSEWYGIYRKVSSPPFDFSVDNCVRLELVKNSWLLKNNTEHLTCGDGITDPAEIAAFLADVRSQKSPEEAGLYDLVRKENGFLENCYQYGVIYGFFSEEPNLAVPLTVTSYNDMAYSVSIEQKEYVLPEKWVKRLRGKS
ncbi:MAG: hypothetical protein IKP19_04640 [Oscillospiraceae bacterium]|nr:hypothetical protein [Oscillospiraceae bacterium]